MIVYGSNFRYLEPREQPEPPETKPDGRRGTLSAYTMGCRCLECEMAKNDYDRERRSRAKRGRKEEE